jgi:hypothetical protein
MAIISGTRAFKKSNVNVEINTEVLDQINAYCAWANISDVSFFFEEAATFVFAKDKDWKLNCKVAKRAKKQKAKAKAA